MLKSSLICRCNSTQNKTKLTNHLLHRLEGEKTAGKGEKSSIRGLGSIQGCVRIRSLRIRQTKIYWMMKKSKMNFPSCLKRTKNLWHDSKLSSIVSPKGSKTSKPWCSNIIPSSMTKLSLKVKRFKKLK